MYYIYTKDKWVLDNAYTWKQAVTKRNHWHSIITKEFAKQQRGEDGRYLKLAPVPDLLISEGYPSHDSQPTISDMHKMDVSGYEGN
jgi:hypothetical protein